MTKTVYLDANLVRRDLEAAEADLKVLTLRRDALRRMLIAAEELAALTPANGAGGVARQLEMDSPETPSIAPNGFPRGREAILAVLAERGMEMDQRQIFSVMNEKGWVEPGLKAPYDSVRVTLRRMWKKGEIEKKRDGVYAPLADRPQLTAMEAMSGA
jgi:hypothetical protein